MACTINLFFQGPSGGFHCKSGRRPRRRAYQPKESGTLAANTSLCRELSSLADHKETITNAGHLPFLFKEWSSGTEVDRLHPPHMQYLCFPSRRAFESARLMRDAEGTSSKSAPFWFREPLRRLNLITFKGVPKSISLTFRGLWF